MGDSDGMLDVEEIDHRAGCAGQVGEDRVADGSPLLDRDVDFDCEGGVLDGW